MLKNGKVMVRLHKKSLLQNTTIKAYSIERENKTFFPRKQKNHLKRYSKIMRKMYQSVKNKVT